MGLENLGQSSIDLTSEVVPCPREPIGSKRAWLAADISQGDWRVPLDDAAQDEIAIVVEALRAYPLPVVLRSSDAIQGAALHSAMARIKTILDNEIGFAVLDALPMDDFDIDEMIAVFWMLGQFVGTTVAQKWDGTMIYDVTDTGKKYGYGVRGSATNVELVFHTDNAFGVRVPDYVGLLCKYPAIEGGVSRFCSLYTLHNRLLADCPELLARLYEPMLFDRQAEHAPGAPKTATAPFFSHRNGKLAARANVALVRKGYEVAEQEMDSRLDEALAAAHEASSSPDLWYEAPLSRGQVQYLNNHELGHYRSEFTDNPDTAKKRHLYRTWHSDHGARTYDG